MAVLFHLIGGVVRADQHPTGVPQLSSRPGAAYTIYLDFAGFNFTGTWGGSSGTKSPGNTAAFENVPSTGAFDADQQARIAQAWAAVAQAYAPFSVNVTTIDPAIAAGKADTDAHRQAYYDSRAKLMHTVITPSADWYGSAGGVSYKGVMKNPYNTLGPANNNGAGAGWHTNWDFAQTWWPTTYVAQPSVHENGHALNLSHQSDYQNNTLVNEYTNGDNNAAAGTYGAIMGAGYYTQRSVWRSGDSNNNTGGHLQNDVALILSYNPAMTLVNDGIGHSLATATALPLIGADVDFNLAAGVIVPSSSAAPLPMGIANYTSDYFSFQSDGITPISLTLHCGTQFLAPGTADPGATLRGAFSILDGDGLVLAAGVESVDTLSSTYAGLLPAGDYYALIGSYGGHAQTITSGTATYNTTYYYDMGAYFLTGSGFGVVPEPGSLALLAAAGVWGVLVFRRRRTGQR